MIMSLVTSLYSHDIIIIIIIIIIWIIKHDPCH